MFRAIRINRTSRHKPHHPTIQKFSQLYLETIPYKWTLGVSLLLVLNLILYLQKPA